MRAVILTFALALGVLFSAGQAHAVCNIRGQHCGYPAWAANAFTHPKDRVPDYALEDIDRRTRGVHESRNRHDRSDKRRRYWR